jgi:hypothetical protein
MAGALLAGALPFVSEIGFGTGAAVAEATGSSLLGSAVTGGIFGTIGNEIEKGSSLIINKIFGAETTDKIKNEAFKSLETAKALGLFGGNAMQNREIIKNLATMDNSQIISGLTDYGERFTEEYVNKAGGTTVSDIIFNLAKANPLFYYISSKLLEKTSAFVLPLDDPDYIAVSQVYDGSGLYNQMGVMSSEGEISMIDETGKRIVWKYPEYNDYPVVPAIYGTWVGMNSYNDQIPLNDGVNVSLMDTLAFLHDCSYLSPERGGYGVFNKFGDMQLLSRYNALKDKFTFDENEKFVADLAANWFSTLGFIMRELFGNDPNNESVVRGLYKETFDVDLTAENVEALKEEVKNEASRSVGGLSSQEQNLVSMINNLEISID